MTEVSMVDTFLLKFSKAEECQLVRRGLCHCHCLRGTGTTLQGQCAVHKYLYVTLIVVYYAK